MKQIVVDLLKKHVKGIKNPENFIEIPADPENGDYSFPTFTLAKTFKKNPKQIALELQTQLGKKLPKEIKKVEAVNGYLNFFVDRNKFASQVITQILKEKDKYGSVNVGKGQKALIEHTSINPNASPHVGRARNAIIGDSLVRIFRFLGFKTETHYYVNDVSKQIAMLVLGNADRLGFEGMLKKYIEVSGKVAKSKALEIKVFQLLNKFESGDRHVVNKFNKITKTCVQGQSKILSDLGIKYDVFDYESKYLKDQKTILAKLKKSGKLEEDDDHRLVLNQAGTSVESSMRAPYLVLTRNDKTGLYPLRDLAYTIEKAKKAKPGKNIIILGEDQKLYFQQLSEALKLLKSPSPEVVHYSFILIKSGESEKSAKKMSTRKGDVVLLEDFLNEAIQKAKKEIAKRGTKGHPKIVGVGAVKYSILRNSPNRIINFNLEDALTFEGDTGPYIQYSYARASSILRKAGKPSKTKNSKNSNLDAHDTALAKKLAQFPAVTQKAYKDLNPSHIANYSYQLAQIFNEFYHASKVIGSEQEAFRLSLLKAFRQVLKNSLELLGIDVLEEM